MGPNPTLSQVLQHPRVWRIGQMPAATPTVVPTGFAALDRELPARGWEQGALTEILTNEQGIGELSLLAPAIRQVAESGQSVVLVAPPFVPFPQAWESRGILLKHMVIARAEGPDLLWATEQAAHSGACGMVITWAASCRKDLTYQALRRLHTAAGAGSCALILYRPAHVAAQASAALTRITACARNGALEVILFKRRAGLMASPLRLEVFPARWARRAAKPAPNRTPAPAMGVPVPANSPPRSQSASW